ncbi:MAG TPA: nicotinate-nucleotide adenylyltransferase [Terriglobales bacterium]|nr:nicotinate-nucleotide adenylyltransferase [Terriglobales bacterium]
MNIGLFGGTFDPIHRGHLALASAAREQFKLGRIYFVPASVPPHKQRQPLTAFCHRYAMVVLATQDEKTFVPSLLEAPEGSVEGKSSAKSSPQPNYSIATVCRLRQSFRKSDQLFFLIGIDAFLDIAKWHKAEELLQECEFLVASRPGYSLADVANALPEKLRPGAHVTKPFAKQPARGDLVLRGVTIRLLEGVHQPVSATAIREAAAAGRSLKRFVDPRVEEYIRKMELYR